MRNSSKIKDNSGNQLEICFFCNRKCEIIKELKQFTNCSHYICELCLFERIFSNYINQLQGKNDIKIFCKCEKGFLEPKLSEILKLVKNKRITELKKGNEKRNENIDSTKEGCECSPDYDEKSKKFSDYFCIDCLKFVCSKCKLEKKNNHYFHRVVKSRIFIKYIKENINSLMLKYYPNGKKFEEKLNILSNKFMKIVNEKYNNTISKLEDLVKLAKELKEHYIIEYKRQLENNIRTFKIIKFYYSNYFSDKDVELKKVNAESNDIFKLKYLNNISYEFTNLELNHSNKFDEELDNINNKIDSIIKSKMDFLEGKYEFEKIQKAYTLDEMISAHNKFITSLILVNNKIITSSTDYFMKVFENESGEYVIKQALKTKQIRSLLGLKNGKIFASVINSNDILIYEMKKDKEEYYNSQSLTKHDKPITTIIELDDGKVVSCSVDGRIIIWQENEKSKLFNPIQEIETNKQIILSISLSEYKLAYTGVDDGVINIIGAKANLNEDTKIIPTEFNEICKLEKQKGKVSCMCKLNNGYFASGGADFNKNYDRNIYIWKPNGDNFTLSQTIYNAHQADINSLILLRNGKIASSSKDHTIKIWGIAKIDKEFKIKYVINQELNHYAHGLYKLIQLPDDRLVVTATDNNLVFWRNSEGIF